MNRIVIVTDCVDVAANELRAAIINVLEKCKNGDNVQIEPIVFAKEFSIINGAFLIRLLAEIYQPKKTTFLAVVNGLPTNRSDRARLVGTTKNGFSFVGENTGIFSWLIKDFGLKDVFETNTKGLDGKGFISFGGKYIHAPVAAKVAAGFKTQSLGKKFDRKRLTMNINIKNGTVIHIDNFNVAKIYGEIHLLKEGDSVKISSNNGFKCNAVFTNSMKNLADNTWAVYRGSSLGGLTELGCVRNPKPFTETNTIEVGDILSFRK